jgi:hypothetical protein
LFIMQANDHKFFILIHLGVGSAVKSKTREDSLEMKKRLIFDVL